MCKVIDAESSIVFFDNRYCISGVKLQIIHIWDTLHDNYTLHCCSVYIVYYRSTVVSCVRPAPCPRLCHQTARLSFLSSLSPTSGANSPGNHRKIFFFLSIFACFHWSCSCSFWLSFSSTWNHMKLCMYCNAPENTYVSCDEVYTKNGTIFHCNLNLVK